MILWVIATAARSSSLADEGRDVYRSVHHSLVDMRRQGFGEKICQVVCSLYPMRLELSLLDPVTHPMKPNINAFGSFYLELVVGEPNAHALSMYRLI